MTARLAAWRGAIAMTLALAGCGRVRAPAPHDDPPYEEAAAMPPSTPTPAPSPSPRVDVDLAGGCAPVTMQPVADAVEGRQHPCSAWVEAVYGRLATVWQRYGGTYWAVGADGIGVLVTCRHCFDTVGGLRAPAGGPKQVAAVGLPPRRIDGAVLSLQREGQFQENAVFLYGYTIFARALPPAGAPGRRDVPPRDDFVVLAVPGDVVRPPAGQLWLEPPAAMSRTPAIHADPLGLTRAEVVTAPPVPGEPILALGFPQAQGGQLVFTVSTPLSDDEAADVIRRAEPEEARIPYDPRVEFLFPAQSTDGWSGGGVFDRHGRYLGVVVRSSLTEVDGRHFTRVVRADYVAAALRDALDRADDELAARVRPLVAPVLPREPPASVDAQ